MARIQWRMKGHWLKNCSCNAGCPCDFNQEPTHHVCEGMLGMQITKGNFGTVQLDGLKWAAKYKWPGPIHQGNGTAQPLIDSKANQKQRQAVLKILSGEAGGTWFEVVKSVVSKFEEPQFVPIDFEFDIKNRHAHVSIDGLLETVTEPIKNPVTGMEHRIEVNLPEGIEYKRAEIGNSSLNRGRGTIEYNWPNGHSSMAKVDHTNKGLKG
ncbi:MAG: DUF1326 domain-containing protein [Candidatus Bathyarchaeia archaeon]